MIELPLRNGLPPESVKAEIHGLLGVHESVSGSGVTVSHVPTGRHVLKNVSRELALQFIEETKGIDWSNPAASRSQIEVAILKANPKAKI